MTRLPLLAMTRFALLTLLLAAPLWGCDSADLDEEEAPPTPATVAEWEGSYTGQSRFGGANGTWGNGGTYPLVVSRTGQVTISGDLIVGATYYPETGNFTWNREAGNATNGSITFRSTFTSASFFGDFNNDTAGQNFAGSIRIGSDGPLGYRGVLR